MAESATTSIASTLEMPLFKGSRVFVRDAHLFIVGKYVVIARWFVAMIVGKGWSIIIDEPSPQDFPAGTPVQTKGQDDVWTLDESGRMLLNGIPTNLQSSYRETTPQESEIFQTPPHTPRQQVGLDMEDDGIIYLNRILPFDLTYENLHDILLCGKPRPPHDFDQDVTTEESPLHQWLLEGSSKRSHHHWRQIYQYYTRNQPTPSDLNGRDMILKPNTMFLKS